MTDDMDVDAMLDAALERGNSYEGAGDVKENNKTESSSRSGRSRSPSGSRDRKKRRDSRSRSRDRSDRKKRSRSRSRSRDRKRSRSRSRDRKRSRTRSRSRDRKRSRSKSRDRSYRRRSRSRDYRRRSPPRRPRIIDHRDRRDYRDRRTPIRSPPRSRLPGPERRDVMPFNPRHSPPKNAKLELSAEERDQRTLLIMQIARDTRPRDLEEFFSAVGAVRDVRIITDSRTGRSKGICYVEFWDEESVPLGLALNGQRLMGAPLQIQRTCAERNRAANASVATTLGFGPSANKGPTKVAVENLHPKISEKMLEEVFDSFGRIEKVEMPKLSNGDGTGSAYLLFRNAEDATKAVEQLNNFELAGKCIRLSIQDQKPTNGATDNDASTHQRSLDDMDNRQGFSLGSGGRQQLMAKLAQGTGSGMELTAHAQMAANQASEAAIPAIATQCFLLSNMFDPKKETEPNWDADIRDDVIEQCLQHGGALHVFVDKGSDQGNVYVKCPSIAIAHLAVTALHGRWFSGKIITANYVPVNSYHELFPDAVHSRSVLQARGAAVIPPPPMMGMAGTPGNGYPPPYGMMPPPPPNGPPAGAYGGYY